ncbi:MAG: hypothetical protein WA089_03210 [Anaerolineae bacterium]
MNRILAVWPPVPELKDLSTGITPCGTMGLVDCNTRSLVMQDAHVSRVLDAVNRALIRIQWKPGKAASHLTKRIRLGHLPAGANLDAYEAIIISVLQHQDAQLFIFTFQDYIYPTVVAPVEERLWLVMIGMDGVMETAFPPRDPSAYLADSAYAHLGRLQELWHE